MTQPGLDSARAASLHDPVVSLPNYAADAEELARSVPSATLETLPGGFVVCAPAPFTLLPPQEDARYHQRLTRAVAVYSRRMADKSGLYRIVTLHCEPDDQDRALRYARLSARLIRLHRDHFGREALFGRSNETADVWLVPGPAPDRSVGGETRGDQLYVWGTQTETRTPLEWTRTLVHEWGHLTLPAARGFREPEGDASGFLGERLYFKWLHDDTQTFAAKSPPDDGTTTADLDLYARRQVEPLIARWQSGGPSSPLLNGKNTEAMDYYIGMALGIDQTFGSPLLGRALYTVLDVHPHDLASSLTRVVGERPAVTVRLPAWVPLLKEKYLARALAGAGGVVSFGANAPSVSLRSDAPTELRNTTTGWRYLRVMRGDIKQIVLRRVSRSGSEDAE